MSKKRTVENSGEARALWYSFFEDSNIVADLKKQGIKGTTNQEFFKAGQETERLRTKKEIEEKNKQIALLKARLKLWEPKVTEKDRTPFHKEMVKAINEEYQRLKEKEAKK